MQLRDLTKTSDGARTMSVQMAPRTDDMGPTLDTRSRDVGAAKVALWPRLPELWGK